MLLVTDPVNPERTTYVGEIPARFKRYVIPSAIPYFHKAPFGSIFLQHLSIRDCNAWYTVITTKEKSSLYLYLKDRSVSIHYMLQGCLTYKLGRTNIVKQEEKQYNLYYFPGGARKINFHKGTHAVFFIEFSYSYLQRLEHEHKELRELLRRYRDNSEHAVQLSPGYISSEIKQIINYIMQLDISGAELELELNSCILKLLSKYIHELTRLEISKDMDNNDKDWEIILEYIEKNLDNKHLNITNISEHFRISIRTLQREFRKRTKMSPISYISGRRIELGWRLLTTTMESIKSIAYETGYNSPSSFTRAFKKHYKITPKEARDGTGVGW